MESLAEIKSRLVCPSHGDTLKLEPRVATIQGVPWPDGQISCPKGCIFRIEQGIPRFVRQDNYASTFGLQWKRYQKTQLDSYTKEPISRQRLEQCLGAELDELKDRVVLECGSGAGRFTELLVNNCASLVSLDLSDAVDANLKNCSGKKPYILCQADINQSPLPRYFFDVVICIGVIPFTASPEQTIRSLGEHLKPGGILVIDLNIVQSFLHRVSRSLTIGYPLRAILKRLPPELGLKATIALTAICDPIRKRTCKHFWLDRVASRIFPSACLYDSYPQLDPKIAYEWNELDTHDYLTRWYNHVRTPQEVDRYLSQLGFERIIYNTYGRNGLEARAILSAKI